MLLQPLLFVAITLLESIQDATAAINNLTSDLPAIVVPWPVEWLPVWPVVGALSIGTFTMLFFLSIKVTRWVYGLVPFAQ